MGAGRPRQVLEGAVLDDVDLGGVDAQRAHEPLAAVLGVHDDGVDCVVEAALCGELAAARLARKDVVCGEHERAISRQQVDVDGLDGQPLEVHDVGAAGSAR